MGLTRFCHVAHKVHISLHMQTDLPFCCCFPDSKISILAIKSWLVFIVEQVNLG